MKKLLRLLTLVPLLAAVSLNAFAVTASVTVNATSSGTITSTQLGSIAGAGGGLPPGFCECSGGRSQGGYIPSSGSYDGAERHNTWSSGSYTITAGTNAIALNITDTPSGVASLDQLLCGTIIPGGDATPPIDVCICTASGNTTTSNGACTANSGQITPTCSGGHVVSVTSNLTLTCP